MSRGGTVAFAIQLLAASNRPVHLVDVAFRDGSTAYITDAHQSISYGGNTYTAVGYLLGFSDIEETATLQINRMTISLAGIDQVLVSAFLSYDYLDQSVKVYRAFLDSDWQLVANPLEIFNGRMDEPVLADDPGTPGQAGKSVLSVVATSNWADVGVKSGRHTNHEEQQIHFPGDTGFLYSAAIPTQIIWGNGRSVFSDFFGK